MSLKSIYYTNDENIIYEEKMKNIFKIQMCKRVLKNETNTSNGVPFFKIGTFGSIPDSYISNEMFLEYKQKYNYPSVGEVLISCSGTVGKCVVFDGNDAYFQDSNILWFQNDELKVLNSYLYYYLSIYRWDKQNSSTITRIYKQDLEDIMVRFPNFDLQYKISEAISSIDNLICSILKKKEQLIKLSNSYRTYVFKNKYGMQRTTIGRIVVNKVSNRSMKTLVNNAIYPVYDASKIVGYSDTFDNDKEIISMLKDGSGAGRIRLLPARSSALSTMSYLIPIDDKYTSTYIYYSLKEVNFETYKVGSSIPHVYYSDYKNQVVYIHDYKKANNIAAILSSMDKLIELEEKKLEKLELMKKYYLQQIFD